MKLNNKIKNSFKNNKKFDFFNWYSFLLEIINEILKKFSKEMKFSNLLKIQIQIKNSD